MSTRLLSLLLASAMALQTGATVDWKALRLDTYPAEARAQIAAARDAVLVPDAAADAFGQLGLVLHAWDQFDLAAQAYAEARRRAPAAVDWWVFSGLVATRAARHADAATYFARARDLAPSPLLHLRHADALLESGQPEAARTAYQTALSAVDAEPAARYGLGRVALALGDPERARQELTRAVELVPTFGAAHYALAQVHRRLGDLAAARASLAQQQTCLTCWPIPSDPWTTRLNGVRTDAAALLRRAVQLAGSAKEDAAAIALHEQALARDPGLLQARVNLITLYVRTGNRARAEAEYRRVLQAGTQLAEAHRAYGLALATTGDLASAEPALRAAVEANPLDAAAQNALGLICESSGRTADAEAFYTRAVAADPRVRAYRFNLARLLTNGGRLDAALAHLQQLHDPDDAEAARYVFATAVVLLRRGDFAEARRLSADALARARRHGAADLASMIEREMQKLK